MHSNYRTAWHHGIQGSPMMVYSNVLLRQTTASFVDPEISTDTINDLNKSITIAQWNISGQHGATRANRQLKITPSAAVVHTVNEKIFFAQCSSYLSIESTILHRGRYVDTCIYGKYPCWSYISYTRKFFAVVLFSRFLQVVLYSQK